MQLQLLTVSRYGVASAVALTCVILSTATSDASARGEHGFPCIVCSTYDSGWMFAAENRFRKLSDCEPANEEAVGGISKQSDDDDEDEEDEDAAEDDAFNDGCKDYVRSRSLKDDVFSK